jgi:hypothetical protein
LPCPNAGKPIPVLNPAQDIMVGVCCFAPKLPNPPNPVRHIKRYKLATLFHVI